MIHNFSVIKSEKFKNFVGFIAFICIVLFVFSRVTYLFRNMGYDRNHVVGIKSESDIDMVYVGGSTVFVFWEPLKAWNDCGFTSYNLAINSIQAENIKAFIEWSEKYQDPQLYVIGVRAFQLYSDEQYEAGLRNGSDGMNITSLARYNLLKEYFNNHSNNETTDVLSYYFDISKYHTNTVNLTRQAAWEFINNEGVSNNKGWEWIDRYGYVEKPVGFMTQTRGELLENDTKVLYELLDYCKSLNKDFLFVVCPYAITCDDKSIYNTIEDAVESYGFQFLDANEYYDEMDIDFSTDFYERNHVNLFGAKKYTEFLENYIMENYGLPDHRNDDRYASWNEDAARFFEEEKVHEQIVSDLKIEYDNGIRMTEELTSKVLLSEWLELALDGRYTLIVAGKEMQTAKDFFEKIEYERIGLSAGSMDFIRVYSNGVLVYSNANDRSMNYAVQGGLNYSIDLNSNTIEICGETYPVNYDEINVVVIDNDRMIMADKGVINSNGESLVVERD